MRRCLLFLCMAFGAAPFLYAAWSDARAMSEAKKLFGPMANIAQLRGPTDTYWTKQVGVDSKGCNMDFTPLGSGLNTWEAAFFNVAPGVIYGPYSGVVTLQAIAWDDRGVTVFAWLLDSKPLGPEIRESPVLPRLEVSVPWDTKTSVNGIHVLCAWARDAAGHIGRSRAILISIDQTKPSVGSTVTLSNMGGTTGMVQKPY